MNIKSELQSNNVDLQTVLDKVNALPDAGSGGSGGGVSVETCTVTVEKTASGGSVQGISATTVEGGIVAGREYGYILSGETQLIPSGQTGSITLEVVCGTIISLFCSGGIITYSYTDNLDNLTTVSYNTRPCWLLRALPGETATISFADLD